jgi:SAM-dependent methyltransferase
METSHPATSPQATDRAFSGSIPRLYEQLLVPLIFEGYATDLARRTAVRRPMRVLEVAAGTGVVTRRLAATLDPASEIVATDLNQGMLDHAATIPVARPVTWRQADAQELPFEDGAFDAVVCQFGAMFFPDKPKAFAEARRVLKLGGALLFNVWDRVEVNEFAAAITDGLAGLFRADPPRFLPRVPYGYNDPRAVKRDLAAGGFDRAAEVVTVTERARASEARIPALAFCQGTPLRGEIEARDAQGLERATDAAEREVARRFGTEGVDARIQAHVVVVVR